MRKYSYYLLSIFKLLSGFSDPILLVRIFLNLAHPGVKTVRLQNSGLQFQVRGAMDVWSVKEVFLDRFYEKYGFVIQPDWNIVDIGAGIGDYTVYAANVQPGTNVFSYEPYPQSFALMRENLRLNSIANARIFNDAVGAVSGKIVLDLSGGEPLQIQSRDDTPANSGQTLTVNSLTLADILTKLDIESCDLLKLDCEGAEYPILFNAPPSVLKRVRRIVMEYHDNVSTYNHNDLVRFLQEQGFEVETFPNPVHSHLGYLRALHKKGGL